MGARRVVGIRRGGRVGATFLASMGFFACSGETDAGPDPVSIRDSAGVRIVESEAPSWSEEDRWSVHEPLLEIGEAQGDEAYQFSRIEGAFLTSEGRLVVADGGSAEYRVFDSEGVIEARWGGRGDGPGEFRLIESTGPAAGDSVWAYDFVLRRLTLMSLADGGARVAALTPPIPNLGTVGRMPDGSFVFAQHWSNAGGGFGEIEGLRRDPAAMVRYAADGTFSDTVASIPGREFVQYLEGDRMVMGSPLFGRAAQWAQTPDGWIVGDQETFELVEMDRTGRVVRILRQSVDDLRITDAQRTAEMNRRIDREDEPDQPAVRRMLESLASPDTRPAYGPFLVDALGNLWVESSRYDDPNLVNTMHIFDAGGRYLGRVEMPDRFSASQILDDRVVGVMVDDLGIERVQIRPLIKPGS